MGSKNQHPHTLVINGRRYSAVNGQALGPQSIDRAMHIDGLHHPSGKKTASVAKPVLSAASAHSEKTQSQPRPAAVRSLDGPSHAGPKATPPVQRVPLQARHLHRRPGTSKQAHATRHTPPAQKAKIQRPSTLTKPVVTQKPQSKTLIQGATEAKARAERAQHIQRSAKISKFVFDTPATSKTAHTSKPQEPIHTPPPVVPITNTHHRAITPAQYRLDTATPPRAPHSGKTPKIIGHKGRLASLATLSLSALLIGGYAVYLNAPHLALRVAASRAGVDAELPGYSPSGYRYAGPINYRPGSVVINFKGDSGQEYALSQEISDWDSSSLLENLVARESSDYQTFQQKGLTVYIYNGSHAAWVNGGMRYTIEGTASIEPDQLLKIAASL